MKAYIWAQSNNDLEEHAGKDVRQEELLFALSVLGRFLGAWEISHGKPPSPPANAPSERFENACSRHFFVGQRKTRGMLGSIGYGVRACLGF